MKTAKTFIMGLCALALVSAAGCQQKGVTVISGTIASDSLAAIPGAIVKVINVATYKQDTVALNGNKFKATVPTACDSLYGIVFSYPGQDPYSNYSQTVIPDAPKISVTLGDSSTVSGGTLSKAYLDFGEAFNALYLGDKQDEAIKLTKNMFEANTDNYLGITTLGLLSQIDENLDLAGFEELYNKAGENVQNSEEIKSTLEELRKADATSKGKTYKEIVGKTADGAEIKLSDYAGKGYVLVDFWASWCGPCMRSLPELKEIYAKYHKKGLEVVGVNVWENKAEDGPKCAVEKEMKWPVIYTDNSKDKDGRTVNVATDDYGVAGIPTTILLSPEGTIVERFTGIPDNFSEVIAGYFE